MHDFKDKNIIVVGGSSGIGLRLSLDLKRLGGDDPQGI
jgi:NAD(P)-dependent dehydrogenase (short-subunit alcohol dehydrogenase family)